MKKKKDHFVPPSERENEIEIDPLPSPNFEHCAGVREKRWGEPSSFHCGSLAGCGSGITEEKEEGNRRIRRIKQLRNVIIGHPVVFLSLNGFSVKVDGSVFQPVNRSCYGIEYCLPFCSYFNYIQAPNLYFKRRLTKTE